MGPGQLEVVCLFPAVVYKTHALYVGTIVQILIFCWRCISIYLS